VDWPLQLQIFFLVHVLECQYQDETVSPRCLHNLELIENNIEAKIHYPIPIYKQKALGNNYNLMQFPVTDHQAQNVISFPCDQHLNDLQLEEITNSVKEFYSL
jgi:dTDP-4-amino-4,6-dideoxygalactose transaminase